MIKVICISHADTCKFLQQSPQCLYLDVLSPSQCLACSNKVIVVTFFPCWQAINIRLSSLGQSHLPALPMLSLKFHSKILIVTFSWAKNGRGWHIGEWLHQSWGAFKKSWHTARRADLLNCVWIWLLHIEVGSCWQKTSEASCPPVPHYTISICGHTVRTKLVSLWAQMKAEKRRTWYHVDWVAVIQISMDNHSQVVCPIIRSSRLLFTGSISPNETKSLSLILKHWDRNC